MELLTPDAFYERVGVRVPDSVILNLLEVELSGMVEVWPPRKLPPGLSVEVARLDAASIQLDLLLNR